MAAEKLEEMAAQLMGFLKRVNFDYVACSKAVLDFAQSAYTLGQQEERERCAKIAEAHGNSIGENCWNHENSQEAKAKCWEEIASAIRSEGR